MATRKSSENKLLHFSVSGHGPVIILLHGFLESGEIWKNFVRRLAKSFRVITIDLPGHGESDTIRPVQTIDHMAEAVGQVVKALSIHQCIMVGHSMGGYVALAFADKYPKLLRGIVLFHSHAGADSPEAMKNRDRTISLVENDHHGFIKNFIPGLFDPENVDKFQQEILVLKALADKTPKEGIIAALKSMKDRPDRQHVLINSKVPVLFIIGKKDSRIPMELILPQSLLPPHAELLLLDHVGHMGFIEASNKTFSTLKSFTERFS